MAGRMANFASALRVKALGTQNSSTPGFVRTTDELQERFFFGCLTALGRRKSAAKVLSGRGDPAD